MNKMTNGNAVRVRLGPLAQELIEGSTEIPAIALEAAIEALRQQASEGRDTPHAGATNEPPMSPSNLKLMRAVDQQSDAIAHLTDLVDLRTRELANIFLHISGLVGTKFANDEETKALHERLSQIARGFDKDAQTLGTKVRDLSRQIEPISPGSARAVEEQNLTVPRERTQEKGRGHER